jgi:hypothetical protein
MGSTHSTALRLWVIACGLTPFAAGASDVHVQRQIQQREQQQMQLQLKMQQQHDHARRPPSSSSGDFQRRQAERDQQQRLQQFHEQQSRATIAPEGGGAPEGTLRDAERQRALQGGAGPLHRYDTERRLQAERDLVAPNVQPQ